MSESELYLRTADVAAVFHVDPKTIARWAKKGLLPSTLTLGGHRRYLESEIRALASQWAAQEETSGETPGDNPAEAPGGEG